jgi:hypothetical protein
MPLCLAYAVATSSAASALATSPSNSFRNRQGDAFAHREYAGALRLLAAARDAHEVVACLGGIQILNYTYMIHGVCSWGC